MAILSFSSFNAVRMPGPNMDEPAVDWPLESVVSGAAAAGLGHVGLDVFTVRHFLSGGASAAEVGSLLDSQGVVCSDVGALIVADPEETLAAAAELASLAAVAGARLCTTAMLAPVDDEVVGLLRGCCDVLAEHGVRMALEFSPYTPLRTLRQAHRVCEQIGFDRCGVLVDSWHFFRSDADFDGLSAMDAAEFGYVQFNDAPTPIGDDLVRESRHRRLPPGQGVFDLDRFVASIRGSGYEGVVSLEVLADDFQSLEPAEQARRGRAALERYWGPARHSTETARRPA